MGILVQAAGCKALCRQWQHRAVTSGCCLAVAGTGCWDLTFQAARMQLHIHKYEYIYGQWQLVLPGGPTVAWAPQSSRTWH